MAEAMTPRSVAAARLGAQAAPRVYFSLLKPRVMSLVVFTAATGLVCADTPIQPFLAVIAILCIAVGAGASGALNMAYDSDIDALMRRTRARPIPAGIIGRAEAAGFGVVLATHDLPFAADVADRVIALSPDGARTGSPQELLGEPRA